MKVLAVTVRGHRLATVFGIFGLRKGGRKTSNVQVDSVSLQAKEYLGFEVLEGEEGSSFYGSRFGGTTVLDLWYLRFNEVEVLRIEGSVRR